MGIFLPFGFPPYISLLMDFAFFCIIVCLTDCSLKKPGSLLPLTWAILNEVTIQNKMPAQSIHKCIVM